MTQRTLKVGTNKAGCRFAIFIVDGRLGVWRECCNYAAHVPGGIAKTWRYCEVGLSSETAEALFQKKLAGKQKP